MIEAIGHLALICGGAVAAFYAAFLGLAIGRGVGLDGIAAPIGWGAVAATLWVGFYIWVIL